MTTIAGTLTGDKKAHSVLCRWKGSGFVALHHRQRCQVNEHFLLVFLEDYRLTFRIRKVKHRSVRELGGLEFKPIRKAGAQHRRNRVIARFKGCTEVIAQSASPRVDVTCRTSVNVRTPERIRLKSGEKFRTRLDRLNQSD